MAHGASADEYDPEAEDFARLIADGEPITTEVVTGVRHKWFGESDEPERPTQAMEALAADLRTIAERFTQP